MASFVQAQVELHNHAVISSNTQQAIARHSVDCADGTPHEVVVAYTSDHAFRPQIMLLLGPDPYVDRLHVMDRAGRRYLLRSSQVQSMDSASPDVLKAIEMSWGHLQEDQWSYLDASQRGPDTCDPSLLVGMHCVPEKFRRLGVQEQALHCLPVLYAALLFPEKLPPAQRCIQVYSSCSANAVNAPYLGLPASAFGWMKWLDVYFSQPLSDLIGDVRALLDAGLLPAPNTETAKAEVVKLLQNHHLFHSTANDRSQFIQTVLLPIFAHNILALRHGFQDHFGLLSPMAEGEIYDKVHKFLQAANWYDSGIHLRDYLLTRPGTCGERGPRLRGE